MSAKMIFFTTSHDEKFLTEEEALEIGDYTKHIWINNVVKKEESYRENQLWGGVYYLSPEENVTEVLITLGQNLNWTFKDNKQIINGYTVWDCKSYNNLIQSNTYTRIVSDAEEKEIAFITYDSLTLQATTGLKIYYYGNKPIPWGSSGNLFEEDSEIHFRFDENGELGSIFTTDIIFGNDPIYTPASFFKIAGNFFEEMGGCDDELYYYTHLEPVVPNF
jgi:hypothetical protein